MHDGIDSMSDCNDSRVLEALFDSDLDLPFSFNINGRCSLIHQNNFATLKDTPSNAHQLFLAYTKIVPIILYLKVKLDKMYGTSVLRPSFDSNISFI